MKKRIIFVAGTSIALSATTLHAQSLLRNILKQVTNGAARANGSQFIKPVLLGSFSQPQTDQLQRVVTNPIADSKIADDVRQNKDIITRLAQTGACGIDDRAWNSFNRESVQPWTRGDGKDYVARGYSSYHDSRFCYDVIRLSGFNKPAANALRFVAFYVSPQTDAATQQEFVLLKTPEGTWLVKEIGKTNGLL